MLKSNDGLSTSCTKLEPTSQEEADTKLILHCLYASDTQTPRLLYVLLIRFSCYSFMLVPLSSMSILIQV